FPDDPALQAAAGRLCVDSVRAHRVNGEALHARGARVRVAGVDLPKITVDQDVPNIETRGVDGAHVDPQLVVRRAGEDGQVRPLENRIAGEIDRKDLDALGEVVG